MKSLSHNLNFLDTPSDECSYKRDVENTHYFYLDCPLYKTSRLGLMNQVRIILQRNNITIDGNMVNVLLYGHPSISFSDNRSSPKH